MEMVHQGGLSLFLLIFVLGICVNPCQVLLIFLQAVKRGWIAPIISIPLEIEYQTQTRESMVSSWNCVALNSIVFLDFPCQCSDWHCRESCLSKEIAMRLWEWCTDPWRFRRSVVAGLVWHIFPYLWSSNGIFSVIRCSLLPPLILLWWFCRNCPLFFLLIVAWALLL